MVNIHKRGQSLESGVPLKAQDDDLLLFNEMRSSEKDNFLLCAVDDFDDSIAKLRYHSGFRLRVSIPARGDDNDLLNTESDKNDYDWLLTPPDTPLFSSLEDGPQHTNLVPRGRQRSERSQPIFIARPSANDGMHMSSRRSASPHRSSPHRLSPSHSSSKGTIHSRGTPSTYHTSPPAALRPNTPSRRSSTPPQNPQKSILPTARSSTPPKRSSITSSGVSGTRGTSPLRVTRGNFTSPKLRDWKTNFSSFSSDPPPNLRTSLPDRLSSHARGLSPASRNGRHSTSPAPRNSRQSMSPTASRSASSSYSHERDRLSSYSKGSALSSGDDDVESLQSLVVATSCSPSIGKIGLLVNSRSLALSKKLIKTPTATYSAKRGFNSVQRQVDHWKTPQNMFRPLLSSAPASSFYSAKASSLPHSLASRNSSPITNSEQGNCVVPDIESGEKNNSNLSSELENPNYAEPSEEIFNFDPMDGVPESGDIGGISEKIDSAVSEKSVCNFDDISLTIASESSCAVGSTSDVEYNGADATCSKCGEHFPISYLVLNICVECAERDKLLTTGVCEFVDDGNDILLHQREGNLNNLCLLLHQETDPRVLDHSGLPNHQDESPVEPDNNKNLLCQRPRTECPEGTGISLLLHRSSSNKWPVVYSRGVSAMSMLSDPSFTKDPVVSVKHIVGLDSASASSIDLGSIRQSEIHPKDPSGCSKGVTESVTSDYFTKSHGVEVLDSSNDYGKSCKASACIEESDNLEDVRLMAKEHQEATVVGDAFVFDDSGFGSKSESLRFPESGYLCDTSGLDLPDCECCISFNNDEGSFANQEMKDTICRDMYGSCHGFYSAVPDQCTDLVSQIISEGLDHARGILHGSTNFAVPLESTSLSTSNDASLNLDSKVADCCDRMTEKYMIPMSRSLALEEATDTILFCSSIIHDLAFKATELATEKELFASEIRQPRITTYGSSTFAQRDYSSQCYKRSLKPQKFRRKRLDGDENFPPTELGDDAKIQQVPDAVSEIHAKPDSTKPPPKQESKCNCSVM